MIIIAQYQGISSISKLIRWQTRSKYSHTAALLYDDSVIEAWQLCGVSHVEGLLTNHTPGTIVDLYKIECTQGQAEKFEEFLLAQVGKKYDYRSIFRFVTRQAASENGKWFCSELITAALIYAGIYMFNQAVNPAVVSPGLIYTSPIPIFLRRVKL